MKLVKQSLEILEQKDFTIKGINQFIEKSGGILESKDSVRPLEFGTVHLKLDYGKFKAFVESLECYNIYNNVWIRYNEVENGDEIVFYVTTNYRYYLEMCKYIIWLPIYLDEGDSPKYPKRYTVHFTSNRLVTDELRYSMHHSITVKDYLSNDLTFVIPNWSRIPEGIYPCHFNEEAVFIPEGWTFKEREVREADKLLLMNYGANEHSYNMLLKFYNWTPQQACSVLPLGVKSGLISCGFKEDWLHLFNAYHDGKPSMAKELIDLLHEKLKW